MQVLTLDGIAISRVTSTEQETPVAGMRLQRGEVAQKRARMWSVT